MLPVLLNVIPVQKKGTGLGSMFQMSSYLTSLFAVLVFQADRASEAPETEDTIRSRPALLRQPMDIQ